MSVLISKNVWLHTKYGQTSLLLTVTMRPWTCKLGSRHRLPASVLLLPSGLQEVSPTAFFVILLVGDVGVSNYCAICCRSQLSSYNFLKSSISSEVLLWYQETSPRMSKKREAPPKPEELIQKLSERLDVVKSNLTGNDIFDGLVALQQHSDYDQNQKKENSKFWCQLCWTQKCSYTLLQCFFICPWYLICFLPVQLALIWIPDCTYLFSGEKWLDNLNRRWERRGGNCSQYFSFDFIMVTKSF